MIVMAAWFAFMFAALFYWQGEAPWWVAVIVGITATIGWCPPTVIEELDRAIANYRGSQSD